MNFINIKLLTVHLVSVSFRNILFNFFTALRIKNTKYTFNFKFSEIIKPLTFVTKFIRLENNYNNAL